MPLGQDLDIGVDADFTPHALRHTAGTAMVRAGTDKEQAVPHVLVEE
ncbi:tyrosine-type recombinase/integrase [Nonomuraea sp. C10]|nr:tyrosine-type recombinase/integrase [Nonomuraea sp. C10]TXK41461.1 phage integrase family protein [Nonomuraea sp. C10]